MTEPVWSHVDDLYALLGELARRLGGPRRLRDCTKADGWPAHGVYLFFEHEETRPDGSGRVVRVGTHALTETSKTTLWNRLAQHRGQMSGSNPGGGNHRGSVFRKHVGTALIRRDHWPEKLLASWTSDQPDTGCAQLEAQLEREVSRHIGAMPFLWLPVLDRAVRGYIERNTIALLSKITGTPDRPSPDWLGHHAAHPAISTSGLWNVHHVDDRHEPDVLQHIAAHVRQAK